VLEPLCGVQIAQKTIKHSPQQKLLDALMGILSGCKALYEINCRLRPDLPLQRAFGRDRGADQSIISRTLNAFTQENVAQLREAVEAIGRENWAVLSHDFEAEMLTLEVDLTGLKASNRSQGATKGYFSGERNTTGRQLVRVSTPNYGEVIFEKLYAGNTTSCEVFKGTMKEVERILSLAEEPKKRKRTLVRLDGGFGTDANLNWLCWRGYESSPKATGGSGLRSWPTACPRNAFSFRGKVLVGVTEKGELTCPAKVRSASNPPKTSAPSCASEPAPTPPLTGRWCAPRSCFWPQKGPGIEGRISACSG
jgi:hypothetical protein